jgi:hypothetical protein
VSCRARAEIPVIRSRLIELGFEVFPPEKQVPEAFDGQMKADAEKVGSRRNESPHRGIRERQLMKLPRRQFLHLSAGAAALPVMSRIASALTYPTRPVRIIAGYPPGGGLDIVARLIGQWLSHRIGRRAEGTYTRASPVQTFARQRRVPGWGMVV